jgi:H/ACA ribonucleoprotein complex subunit 4
MFLTKSDDIAGHGEYPGARKIEELLKCGIIILDKWSGPTSHDVAATVKKTLNLGKVGHGGTLDPMVTGVLTITLENACKVIPALQHLDKEYIGVMRMHKDVGRKDLDAAVSKFIGKIKQRPPLRSAVARKERERTVHALEIIEVDGRNVLFRISCEAGTYVRVVCHDIGKLLGGANMSELRRVRTGRFREEQSIKMEDLADAYVEWKENGSEKIRDYILSVEAAIEHLPKIIVKDSAVYSIANGSPVYTPAISKISDDVIKGKLIAILSLRGELVALAMADMDAKEALARKGIAAKTDRVIIDKKLYKSQ